MAHRTFVLPLLVALLLWPTTSAAQATIEGLVLDQAGRVRNGVAVRLRARFATDTVRLTIAKSDGVYRFEKVAPGDYRVDVLGDGFTPFGAGVTVGVGAATIRHNVVSSPQQGAALTLALITLVIFTAGVLAYRHHNIVHTTRELLLAQLENIETRLPLETGHALALAHQQRDKCVAIEALLARIAAIKASVSQDIEWKEWFFWSRGHEISGWVRLHEVERQIVAFLVPESRVVERAVMAEAQLRALNKPTTVVLADRMRTTLQESMAAGGGGRLDQLQQQLAEGLALLYDEADTGFAGLMEWHNKAMWLVYLSLLAIVVLGLVFGHQELFIVGAVGGLMSRMARTLFREDVPSDYGASWTTLFLSPLLGAISAWAGLAVMAWLRDVEVLGAQFQKVSWDDASTVWVIALGFTLGFSERLFTSLLSKVEGRVTDELQRPQAAAAPRPILPPTMPAAPATRGGAEPAVTPVGDRILAELDLQSGERVAFVGAATSPLRQHLARSAGEAAVADATLATLGAAGPFDAVLFEATPTADELTAAAGQLAAALRPDARVVVLGRSPALLFTADAATQRASAHVGPAVVREVLLAAGFAAQEPPTALEDTDPVSWMVSFVKPAAGGSDR